MRRLLHMPLDPASRMIRIALAEKGLPAELEETRPWDNAEKIAGVNPAGEIPVLIDETRDGSECAIAPASVAIEYLEDRYHNVSLLPSGADARAETRRLIAWFTQKFESDVIAFIVRERIDKRLMRRGQPDYDLLRAGLEALDWHMDYFSWLIDQRNWFAGDRFTAADIAAAGYLSCVDYVDAIAWEKFPSVKEWYARMKSRPAMRPILRDRMEGTPPPRHYADPDF